MKGVIDARFSQNLQILKQPSSKYLSKLKAVNLSYCAHHSTSAEHDLQHNKYPRFLGSALFSFLAINPLKVCFLFCFVLFSIHVCCATVSPSYLLKDRGMGCAFKLHT